MRGFEPALRYTISVRNAVNPLIMDKGLTAALKQELFVDSVVPPVKVGFTSQTQHG